MTLDMIRDALLWCFIINAGLLLVWGMLITLAHDWLYHFHGRWFRLSVETFDAIHYSGIMLWKIGTFLFNLIPYLALWIVG